AVKFAERDAAVGEVQVNKGQSGSVEALTADSVSVVVPKGEDKGFETKVELPCCLNAPVQKEQEIGAYIVTKDGQEVLRVKLVAKNDISKSSVLQQINKIIDSVY
ncbi:MAG: D-alanyl-D-alanine carboxypeptidase, partial [Desulfotomaculaceae bacterium]|nr:D-alanyl-D-alanine carboxypeptidase [Desulfotomaculaceae bacterium]